MPTTRQLAAIMFTDIQGYTALRGRNWSVVSIFAEKLKEYLRYYYFVGGMPEVVDAFIQTRD